MMRRILVALSAVALSACASFEAMGPSGDAALEFTARAAQHGEWLEQPVIEADGRSGKLVVSARLSTPDPCRALSASLDSAGSELTLRVTIRPDESQGCPQVIGTFEYDAVLHGLAPGAYRLRVLHEYPQTGWPTPTVLDQQLQVR